MNIRISEQPNAVDANDRVRIEFGRGERGTRYLRADLRVCEYVVKKKRSGNEIFFFVQDRTKLVRFYCQIPNVFDLFPEKGPKKKIARKQRKSVSIVPLDTFMVHIMLVIFVSISSVGSCIGQPLG